MNLDCGPYDFSELGTKDTLKAYRSTEQQCRGGLMLI